MPKHKQTKKPLADWNLTGVELKKYKYMLTENTKQCNSDRDRALISGLSWSELRSYAKSLNLSAKGTRAEIELRILMADEVPMDNNQDVLSQSERIDAVERELCGDNEEYDSLSQEEKNELIRLIRERLVAHHYLGEKWLRSDWSFNFEAAKFAEPKPKTQPKQAPKTPSKPAKVIPMTPGKKAATMSPLPPLPQGVTLALANLARALKSSNGIAIFSDTFKVVAIAQHFPEIYPGIWKAEFQGSTIGYLQKNIDGTYTGYKECPVREPDISSPKGNFWVDAANKPGSYKVTRVVTAKLSQKVSVHTVIAGSRQAISCDCQGFVYRQHCCHVEAVDMVLRPQEQITQEIEALKVRAELIQEIRDRKLWGLLNLIEPSVLNASLEELQEGNIVLSKELQNALALNNKTLLL